MTIKYDLMKQRKKLISATGMDRSVRAKRENNTDWFLKKLVENFASKDVFYVAGTESKFGITLMCGSSCDVTAGERLMRLYKDVSWGNKRNPKCFV